MALGFSSEGDEWDEWEQWEGWGGGQAETTDLPSAEWGVGSAEWGSGDHGLLTTGLRDGVGILQMERRLIPRYSG
jgi:hypothetical protein